MVFNLFKKTWLDDVIGWILIISGIMNLDYAQWGHWKTLNAQPLNPLGNWFIDYGLWINLFGYAWIIGGGLLTYGEQWVRLIRWVLRQIDTK